MRILIAGLGAIGQRHARNLRALRGHDVDLIALRSRRLRFVVTESLVRDDSRDVEAELGVTAYSDLGSALATRPQAVFICTPSSSHVAIAQRAADMGCDLFIEKPVSHTIDGTAQLAETAGARGLRTLVGCQWRYHPCVRALKALIDLRTLGPIESAEIDYAEYLPDWHPYEDYRQSYAAREELGGGVVLTQIHDYDLACWLFGFPRTVRATGGHLSDLELDVEDTADARLDAPVGPVRVRQSFATRVPRRSIVVRGTRATATLDLLAANLSLDPPLAPGLALPDYQRNTMFVEEAAHFLDCIEGDATPAVPLADGVRVLAVALAVKRAMRSGREEEIT